MPRSRTILAAFVAGAAVASAVLIRSLLPTAHAQDAPGANAARQERPREPQGRPVAGTLIQDVPKPKAQAKAQPRASGTRVKVDPATVVVDDGDTVTIRWGAGDEEIVRILGIDTPETQHDEHNIPIDQPYGREARAFAQGAFAAAGEVELLRCATIDPYGRTLGYLFLNGKNYSLLVVRARLAAESVSTYGDNGFPEIAAEMRAAATAAGPLPFEPPGQFRARMRPLADWRKTHPRP